MWSRVPRTHKNQEAVEAASNRLEGHIDRFREDQTNQMVVLKRNQEHFQEEVKALMANKTPARQNRERRRGFDDGGGGGWWPLKILEA